MSEENEQVVTRRRGRPPRVRSLEQVNGPEQVDENGHPVAVEEMPVRSVKSDLLTESENKELFELQEICDQMDDSNAKVRLYRLGEMGARPYLAEMPVKAFTLEYVKNEFGGGDYIAQFITSENKFFKKLNIKIDPIFKPRVVREEEARRLAAVVTGAPATPANSQDNAALVIQLMQQSADKSDRMFQLMLTLQQENTKSMMLMIGKMFEGNNRSPLRPSFDGQATVIEALTPLLLRNIDAPRSGGVLDDVEKLAKLKELFDGIGGKEEKEDMFEKIMKIGGPVMAGLLSKAMQQPGTATALPAPVGAAPASGPAQPAAAEPKILNVIDQLRFALPLLLNAARKQSAPESYYEFVSDNLNDDLYDQLVQILEKDDWLAVLFGSPPEICADQNVKDWFEKLRQLFLSEDEAEAGKENDAP